MFLVREVFFVEATISCFYHPIIYMCEIVSLFCLDANMWKDTLCFLRFSISDPLPTTSTTNEIAKHYYINQACTPNELLNSQLYTPH